MPALEEIVERFNVSDDVAGATFMAAGGSAPELFTSFIGVFIAVSNVGFGTIVGSAVFNVLFVIGMCAIFSREVLALTWWPLFRDSSYYTLSLLVLFVFFTDGEIEWWESLILFLMYIGYVVLMAYNERLHAWVLHTCLKRPRIGSKASMHMANDGTAPSETALKRAASNAGMTSDEIEDDIRETSAAAGGVGQRRAQITFQAGVFHMLLSHVDPAGYGPSQAKDNRFKRASQMVVHRIKDMKHQGTPVVDRDEVLHGMRLNGDVVDAGATGTGTGTTGAWRSASPLSQNTDTFATAALQASHAQERKAAAGAQGGAPPGGAPRDTPTPAGEPEATQPSDTGMPSLKSDDGLEEVDLGTPHPSTASVSSAVVETAAPLSAKKKSQVVPVAGNDVESNPTRQRTAAEEFGIDDAQSVSSENTVEPTEDDLLCVYPPPLPALPLHPRFSVQNIPQGFTVVCTAVLGDCCTPRVLLCVHCS